MDLVNACSFDSSLPILFKDDYVAKLELGVPGIAKLQLGFDSNVSFPERGHAVLDGQNSDPVLPACNAG